MTSLEELKNTFQLIKQERQTDLEQYRQKVLLTPLHRKTEEGITWYPVRLNKHYIGTGERLILEIERTTQLNQSHVFSSGKMVSLFSNAHNKPARDHTGGIINYVRDNLMIITLHTDELPDWIEDPFLGVDVMFDEMTYREMEFALKEVMKADGNRVAELREILLGKKPPHYSNQIPLFEKDHLNESQILACEKVLTALDVGIIHGPPGTGKTTTLVQAITHTVKQEGQVLVCAPSNAAVDLLAEKLDTAGLRVLRIGHPARVTEQSLSKTLDARIAAHGHYKELKALRKKMTQVRDMAFKYKKKYGYHEKEQRRLLLQEAKSMKSEADLLEYYIVNDLLQNSDVITSTLVGSSHPLLKGKRYKSAFIDEAAQALEPACWIPILRTDRIIFAGDHQQLPPTIKSMEASRNGLALTLFEKCIERQPQTAAMLQVQYRMHENIMRFSSAYFYKNELIAHESVKTATLGDGSNPVVFIDTAGCGFEEQQDPETLSRYNVEEAHLLIKQMEQLINHYPGTWEFTLGIITPYRAQVEQLKKGIESAPVYDVVSPFITVDSVDAFQGQERDVVMISLVRSNAKGEVGFLGDVRRINVAMTRARKKLIMIGDSATLTNHNFYQKLLDFMQENDFYKSAWELTD